MDLSFLSLDHSTPSKRFKNSRDVAARFGVDRGPGYPAEITATPVSAARPCHLRLAVANAPVAG
jgi:hypothetical protein